MYRLDCVKLEQAFRACWSVESCYPPCRDKWTPDDPSYTQCGPTAVVVKRLFGGELYRIDMGNGGRHFYNVVDGETYDFSAGQFHGHVPHYADGVPFSVEDFYGEHPENKSRCEYLYNAVARCLREQD